MEEPPIDFYASMISHDALTNDRGELDPMFASSWTVRPNADYLAPMDHSDLGSLAGTVGYESTPFCDADVKNSLFTRLGELGRLHSYQPANSLRLWAANNAGEQGHDADILDLFRIGQKGRRALGGVDDAESPTGAGADVE